MTCNRIVGAAAALLALAALPRAASARADAPPAVAQGSIEVRLPADAVLTIDGEKTVSTGETRTFQPPALPAGKTYAYTFKATWKGKDVVRKVEYKPEGVTMVDLRPDFAAADNTNPIPNPAKGLAAKEGFETIEKDGRWWIFKSGSKELEEYKKTGDLEKHVTRLNAGPNHETLMAPDAETIDDYLKAGAK